MTKYLGLAIALCMTGVSLAGDHETAYVTVSITPDLDVAPAISLAPLGESGPRPIAFASVSDLVPETQKSATDEYYLKRGDGSPVQDNGLVLPDGSVVTPDSPGYPEAYAPPYNSPAAIQYRQPVQTVYSSYGACQPATSYGDSYGAPTACGFSGGQSVGSACGASYGASGACSSGYSGGYAAGNCGAGYSRGYSYGSGACSSPGYSAGACSSASGGYSAGACSTGYSGSGSARAGRRGGLFSRLFGRAGGC